MLLANCARTSINLVHYNIKELETAKLKNPNQQIEMVKKVIDHLQSERDIDLLSINEIQYDLPGVPTAQDKSDGENLKRLANILDRDDHHLFFAAANTGKKALKRANGDYVSSTDRDANNFSDQSNYGLFPAQYSTGLISQFDIVSSISLRDLRWRDIRPTLNLAAYRDGAGQVLPANLELFDKSFNDITLRDRQGREFHLIMLHTVPAYHFGNKLTPNYARNADQLNFLLWYVTGEAFAELQPPTQIRPLVPGTPFIIVGDLNVDIKSQHPGAVILKQMLKLGIQSILPEFPGTYLGDNISTMQANNTLLNLDYILFSSHFKTIAAGVYLPDIQRENLECSEEKLDADTQKELDRKIARSGKVLVEYLNEHKLCRSLFAKDFLEVAKASDHLPIWASLEWK